MDLLYSSDMKLGHFKCPVAKEQRRWPRKMAFNILWTLLLLQVLQLSAGQGSPGLTQIFRVPEEQAPDTPIGTIGEGMNVAPPPYFVLSDANTGMEEDLIVNGETGSIIVRRTLDRERRDQYRFVAVSTTAKNIIVNIIVTDINDHAPKFPKDVISLNIIESSPRDATYPLGSAVDPDLGINSTQGYEIIEGNINNAFRLSSHRGANELLYLDLDTNIDLDYEITTSYSLLIRAYDGGSPPKYGYMRVNITIIDSNDNQPIFNQSRYFAQVSESASIGQSVLQVFATDRDSGDNGKIRYHIDRVRSDPQETFLISEVSGVIIVNKELDYETKPNYELIVVARDNGTQKLQTTAIVSVTVMDVNDNEPTIDLIFLTQDGTGRISETAKPGDFVARISVSDPDVDEYDANVNVTLTGGDGHFGLTTRNNVVYLVILSKAFDRDRRPYYQLTVTATDAGTPPLQAIKTFSVSVVDMNDNSPSFAQDTYYADIQEVVPPGSFVIQVTAEDHDQRNKSQLLYSLLDSPETHSEWFEIDNRTGLITTRSRVDCETASEPRLVVLAQDSGVPPLTASTTVIVRIRDVNDNTPVFDHSFYNVSVAESVSIGNCILTVTATDPDCGVNARVSYSIASNLGYDHPGDIIVKEDNGQICVNEQLDYETKKTYNFLVLAKDQDGLGTTAMVKVTVVDVNDNRPVFYQTQYNINIEPDNSQGDEVVVVRATDPDSGEYGKITYSIVDGNVRGLFTIDSSSGVISLQRPLGIGTGVHMLHIQARDGGGLTTTQLANVTVSVLQPNQHPPTFQQTLYHFTVREDASPGRSIGSVSAVNTDRAAGPISYSVVSGDMNNLFSVDMRTGEVRVQHSLDHDTVPFILLGIQAQSGSPPSYDQAQVNISITDVNDNTPKFPVEMVEIPVKENTALNRALFMVQASDADSGLNGEIQYFLDDPAGLLTVVSETGVIRAQRPLDFEEKVRHEVVVKARDRGNPPRESSMRFIVLIQDVNDNPPIFSQTEYSFTVLESTAVNSKFAPVVATDKDSNNNGRITYSLEHGPDNHAFGIFSNDGYLYNKINLDREKKSQYHLRVVATDGGVPAMSSVVNVTISVLDANDNSPVFQEPEYTFQLSENQAARTRVGYVSATDRDQSDGSNLHYSIITPGVPFEIDAKTGEIITTSSLDREERETFTFTVQAKDDGSPPQTTSVVVTLMVLDVNDNSPVFSPSDSYQASVDENQKKETVVTHVSATDADSGDNAAIMYSLAADRDAQMFAIHPNTGLLTTKEVLDHETKSSYTLTVIAKDNGSPSRQTTKTITINVEDKNDSPPEFESAYVSFEVEENTPPGTIIGNVQASDKDVGENANVKYYIVHGNWFGMFGVNANTGEIFAAMLVDFEVSSQHSMKIRAVDSSATNPMSGLITVNITVKDQNDNIPTFEHDSEVLSISENTPVDTSVYRFNAIDKDSGPNGLVYYNIASQSPEGSWFSIERGTGVLRVSKLMDYENLTSVQLLVEAEDQAANFPKLKSHINVHVIIEDENDNKPKFQTRSVVDVMEDEPEGFPIIHVIATDQDSRENGRVTYAIIDGNEHGHFRLDTFTGLLMVGRELDRETVTEYRLNITARDNGHPRQQSFLLLTINVVDVNDNPPAFNHSVYTAAVEEGRSVGTVVTTVQAHDPDKDKNAELEYFIPDGIADNHFSIGSTSGVITTSAVLDREKQSSWVITAYVKDGAFPALYDTTTVMVTVQDVNDNSPVFKDQRYYLEVPENEHVAVVHTVMAMDADSGINGMVSYSISDGNSDNRFSIDPMTGKLSCRPLDREMTPSYELSILAKDGGRPPNIAIATVNVRVLDDNDNHPQFSKNLYTATIPENIHIGEPVIKVTAVDPDEGINARVSYHINNTDEGPFKIDNVTGQVITTGLFDREKKSHYTFEVYAIDGGLYGPRHETVRLDVTISDVNDNAPIFEKIPYKANISQTHGMGQYVTQVSAQDKDIGGNADVTYYLVPPSDYFNIDPFSGTITTKRSLLPDAIRVHTLEVVARDNGRPQLSSTGLVEIMVGNAPGAGMLRFSNLTYSVNLPENSPTSTSVLTVQASYISGGSAPISYGFASGNEDNTFSIHPTTGYISVDNTEHLDYEINPQLRLIVVATAGTNTCYTTVWIHLTDINDNPPIFSQDRFTSAVWEENNRGTYVTQVRATDEDSGNNGRISYRIVSGNTQNAFEIDPPNTGIVMTHIQLDREIQDSYRLEIEAMDHGDPPLSSRCTLKIQVIDVNDNKPNFPSYPPRDIREGAELGFLVHQVTANDMDLKPSLVYEFANGGNPEEKFSIDRYSGRIVVAKELDHEEQAQYILSVVASDGVHNDSTNLIVNIIDENDNPPEFSQQSYQVTLPELTPPHYSVITVNATDLDAGENAHIAYSMFMTDGFYINVQTGTIYTNKTVLYNPTQPTLHLGVTATDHGKPALSAVVPVRVQVIDVNNHAPEFTQEQYRVEVSEDTMRGVTLLKIDAKDDDHSADNNKIDYSIVSGNEEGVFQISPSEGDLLLVGALDREHRSQYQLTILAEDRGEPPLNSSALLTVIVSDVNDEAPKYSKSEYQVAIPEDSPEGQSVFQVHAIDTDAGQNGHVTYIFSSGNEEGNFEIDQESGLITVDATLDHETISEYHLVVQATDSAISEPRLSSYTTVSVNITDVNEFGPIFPVLMYIESVMEGQEIGTSVFTAHANDKDGGIFGVVEYQLQNKDYELFAIDRHTGLVTTAAVFDYEAKQEYKFSVVATDKGNLYKDVHVLVNIERKFVPKFAKENYNFVVPGNAKVGDVIGQVQALDSETGNTGQVRYTLEKKNEYFSIGLETGVIKVIKNLQDTDDSRRKRRFVPRYHIEFTDGQNTVKDRHRRALKEDHVVLNVVASAGGLNKAVTRIDVSVNRTCPGCAVPSPPNTGPVSGTPLVLIIVFVIIAVILAVVIIIMYWRNRERKRHPPESHYDSSFETMDVHPPPMPRLGQPPSYNDIPHYPHRVQDPNITTSELSDQSHSASSGRGSAEDADDVDEEIRMINATPLDSKGLRMPDSGIQQDDDAMSEHSVQNHQEYLARLGIDSSKIKVAPMPPKTTKSKPGMGSSVESMHQFSDEGGGEGQGLDIQNLVMSKLGEVAADENLAIMDGTREFGFGETEPSHAGSLSSVINSEEEFSGSYNWDYLLDWGPQYQPLADVFAEIARLKDDSIKPKQQPTHIVPQRTNHTLLHPQVKTVPPPIITNAPPRAVLAQPVSSRPGGSSHQSSSSSSIANSARTSQLTSLPSLPRSPISHESSFTSPALSPSFTPSLTPLATRSPSISPLVSAKGVSSGHSSSAHSGQNTPRRSGHGDVAVAVASSGSEQEIHI